MPHLVVVASLLGRVRGMYACVPSSSTTSHGGGVGGSGGNGGCVIFHLSTRDSLVVHDGRKEIYLSDSAERQEVHLSPSRLQTSALHLASSCSIGSSDTSRECSGVLLQKPCNITLSL